MSLDKLFPTLLRIYVHTPISFYKGRNTTHKLGSVWNWGRNVPTAPFCGTQLLVCMCVCAANFKCFHPAATEMLGQRASTERGVPSPRRVYPELAPSCSQSHAPVSLPVHVCAVFPPLLPHLFLRQFPTTVCSVCPLHPKYPQQLLQQVEGSTPRS